MVGLAADDAAQRHQGVVTGFFGQGLQCHRHFQRAGYGDMGDVFFRHTQGQQLGLAGGGQRVGDGGVKARLHDTDLEFLAVHAAVACCNRAFVCAKHMLIPLTKVFEFIC